VQRTTLSLFFLLALSAFAFAKPAPITVKEIGLMLRSGYPVGAVQNEIAARHFIGSIDAGAEATLTQSGATLELIAALKSGSYSVPPEEIASAQQEIEATARRRALQAEESRKQNTLYQDQLARTRAAGKGTASTNHAVAAMVKGDLVVSRNGILNTFNDQPMEQKKLIALYFAARWCPSCRKFTPDLVQFYNRVAAAHPEFEIVFVSADRSEPAMEQYMRDSQMPWPALVYDKIKEKQMLGKFAGAGIPCLVVIDAQGKVVSDSYDGEKYLGPAKVVADLDRIFAVPGSAVAQAR
jgi:nucleoredoxin